MTALILAGAAALFAIGFGLALWLLDRAEARMERQVAAEQSPPGGTRRW